MNKIQLAAACQVSVVTVSSWISKGCPHTRDARGRYHFNQQAVQAWRKHNLIARPPQKPRPPVAPSYAAARARKESALASLRELQLQERTGELVRRDAVSKAVFASNRAIRDQFMNLPARVSGLVAAETNQHKCFEILANEVRQILEDLSA
jgi:phage terminase Nu1 subunit (DNA packaging protein)